MIMSKTTDPPSVERETASVRRRVKGLGRKLVNRHTLIIAFQVVKLAVRIAEIVRQVW